MSEHVLRDDHREERCDVAIPWRTVREALRAAGQRVDRIDARALLCHAVGRDAAFLIAHSEDILTDEQRHRFDALVLRRAAGEPVAYLVGEREFYGRVFKVTPSVLIPRPETELVVDLALERIPHDRAARVLDLGAGSGCIAVTIALERPEASVVAVERAGDAIEVARDNASRLRAGNVSFLESDWYAALGDARFDIIVSNPPYVARGDPHLFEGDLCFEPPLALEAGEDGLECIRSIAGGALGFLNDGGWLLVEHGYDHAERVRALLEKSGWAEVFSVRDLAGIERVSGGRLRR